ncbi:AbrB family transcriptional regulator [Mitsuokella multacida]|uniref:AbrB family transcriptional regulator n=1 Tax=Mitsuokella multacida TaxID=52226 RepID=UPI002432067D|nr:AbrB family transcriptional regulator [Mitsuokella multacida]
MEYCKTLILSILGGIAMTYLNAPLPWTLGPIVFVALGSLIRKRPFHWSLRIRNTALILLGYAMGRPFTLETGRAILAQFPLMITATCITVAAGVLTAWLMFRHTKINFTSCLLGCVPGGLSQMVILADEIRDADLTAVTIMQTLRMLSVVFIIPFLTIHVLAGSSHAAASAGTAVHAAGSLAEILTYAAVAVLGAVLAKKIHLPTAPMLGPILSTAAFVVITGTTAPVVPVHYINAAQVLVGAYIGSSVDLTRLHQYHGMGKVLLGGVLLVLLVSMGMGCIISEVTGTDLATAFLATAPGGLTEMGITALVVGADSSTMVAYQLTRLLFIMLVFPYIARAIVALYRGKTDNG